MTPEAAFAEAERQLRGGHADAAERTLSAVWRSEQAAPASVLHLLGLIRRAQQRLADAERLLRRAAKLAPDQAAHQLALGDLLVGAGYPSQAAECFLAARRIDPTSVGAAKGLAGALLALGRAEEAEAAALAVLALNGGEQGWELLARALRAQDRLEEALEANEQALKVSPSSAIALHAHAVTLTRLGRNEEGLKELESLSARGVKSPALTLNRGVALLNMTRTAEAEDVFAEGVKAWPFDPHLQHALANVRWMRGEKQEFTRAYDGALSLAPGATQLRISCADLLRRADQRDRAEALLREGLASTPDDAGLLVSLGVLLDECDRTEEGLPLIESAVRHMPNAPPYRANLASALLRLGRGDEALAQIAPARVAEPLNQEWICYETMALRQIGDARYHELCDYERMVRPFDLPAPRGYASIAEFNEALRAALDALHVLESHPLDQSLRYGSQTTRSLLHVNNPIIQSYIAALREPVLAYMASMGPAVANHPWSGRNTGAYKLSGCWSVKLKAHGFHINHLHPAGWISSAYYVSLPRAVAESKDQQGWIKFGEARWPTPSCTVERVIQPEAGRLVLFPSYMWHGTIPFEDGERVTAPFDAIPA